MSELKYLILHCLSEILESYLPECILDDGLIQEDPKFVISQILTKIRPASQISTDQIVDQIGSTLDTCRSNRVTILTRNHEHWPHLLNHFPYPPHVLFCKGNLSLRKKLAVIGSRHPPHESIRGSTRLVLEIAESGFDVVSGGAIGCDISAHLSMLNRDLGSRAVLILPGGFYCPYPRQNMWIFDRILEQGGCWISERSFYHKPIRSDFLRRNRILVGMSLGVLVIHGDERSGTSSSVRLALEQGKEIYVCSSGLVDSPLGQRLVADGAELVG